MVKRGMKASVAAVIIAAAVSMTACGSTSSTAGSTVVDETQESASSTQASSSDSVSSATAGTEMGTSEDNKDSDSIMGQITKIDGNDITITLADSAGAPGDGSAPSGDKPADGTDQPSGDGKSSDGSKPSGDKPSGDKPSDDGKSTDDATDSSKPADGDKPSGDKPSDDGQGQPGMKLSDETKTITVSSSTTYTLSDKSDGALSDLKADDMVTVKMNGDTVVSITVMDMSSQPDGQKPEDGTSAASSEESTSTE